MSVALFIIVKYHDTIYDSRYNQLYSAYKTLN